MFRTETKVCWWQVSIQNFTFQLQWFISLRNETWSRNLFLAAAENFMTLY